MSKKDDLVLYTVTVRFDGRKITDYMIESTAGPSDGFSIDTESTDHWHVWRNRTEKQVTRIERELNKLADKLKIRIKIEKEIEDVEY